MRLRTVRFDRGYADYEVFVCGGSGDAAPDHESSLASGDGELVELEIGGDTRHFLIAVLAANHLKSPFWSSFLVTEMVEDCLTREQVGRSCRARRHLTHVRIPY